MCSSFDTGSRALIVSLHDFHSGSLKKISRQLMWLKELGVECATILAVPDYHGRGLLKAGGDEAVFLRAAVNAGHEVALHGYYHLRKHTHQTAVLDLRKIFYTRLYTANEAEFYDLTLPLALEFLSRGRLVLAECGLNVEGFVAPGWLISPQALDAVWEAGFFWTCLVGEILGREGCRERTRSFCWSTRSAWRVPISLMWNRVLFALNSEIRVARISLHPNDVEFDSIKRQVEKIIACFMARNFLPMSYGKYVSWCEGKTRDAEKIK